MEGEWGADEDILLEKHWGKKYRGKIILKIDFEGVLYNVDITYCLRNLYEQVV